MCVCVLSQERFIGNLKLQALPVSAAMSSLVNTIYSIRLSSSNTETFNRRLAAKPTCISFKSKQSYFDKIEEKMVVYLFALLIYMRCVLY